ncbi:dermonecrotic toxin domain-containing protein [Pseudomonas sp. TE3610]
MQLPPLGRDAPPHASLIATRLPAWLTHASDVQRADYQQRLQRSLVSGAAATAIQQRLRPPAAFCEPLLTQALVKAFNLEVDVAATQLVRLRYAYFLDRRRLEPLRTSLLSAAMTNFAPDEVMEPGSMILPEGDFRLVIDPQVGYRHNPERVLPIAPDDFTRLCRELDLGQQYQAHVIGVLRPPAAELAQWTADHLQANLRDALSLQIARATLTGDLSAATAAQVQALLAGQGEAAALEVCSLRALVTWSHDGTLLPGLLLMRTPGQADGPCVAYLPGAPAQPLKQYPRFADFAADLRRRLRDTAFRHYFQRFVPQAQRQAFFERLANTLSPLPFLSNIPQEDPDADIGLRAQVIGQGLVAQLHQDLVDTAIGDARTWVVPTGDEDAAAREQRLQGYLSLGLDVLNGAAFFVPALGAVMAVAGAAQLLDEVFVGVDDWTHGQTREAVDHCFSVIANLALLAGSAGAGVAIERSPFVEGMLPVVDAQGHGRLWNVPLTEFSHGQPIASDVRPDSLGQYWVAQQPHVKIDGSVYRLAFDSQQQRWYARHPDASRAWRVAVSHNGQGAWRGAHENPRAWTGPQALRRLGALTEGLDDVSLARLQQACGLSDEHVQNLHVQTRPLPALLRLCAADFQAQAQVQTLSAAEQAAAFAQLRQPQAALGIEDAAYPLQRDFPSLTPAMAEEILATATRRERQWLSIRRRVPLRLAERARQAQRALRLNRACTGLVLPASAWPDSARLEAGLLALQPGNPAPGALFEQALADPGQAARLIGLRRAPGAFRWPTRQVDGQIGYPLSGRQPRSVWRRLRALYPRLEETELEALQATLLGGTPEQAEADLARLERQHQRLYGALLEWADEPAPTEVILRQARTEAMERILGVWRRYPEHIGDAFEGGQAFNLNLSDLPIGALPVVEADFAHVQTLSLDGCDLADDPSHFLARFTGVRTLELQENRFTRIPPGVAQIPRLAELLLESNALVASETLFQPLLGLPELETLSLQGNPLDLSADAIRSLASLPSLTELNLSGTIQTLSTEQLQAITALPYMTDLWLRNVGLTLSPERTAMLASMPFLRWLDLSRNPLGATVDVGALRTVRSLDLGGCQLTAWPTGLSELMDANPLHLTAVGLRDNPIVEVPALQGLAMFNAPPGQVASLRITRTHLSPASLAHLRAANVVPFEGPGPDWLTGSPEDVRARAEELRAMPQARYFMAAVDSVEETADYRADPFAGRARIVALIRALGDADAQGLEALREQLFDIGEEAMTTCGDGVQLFLRRSETLVLVFGAAEAALAPEADLAPLLRLGRQLHRESLLDGFVAELYDARVARRSVLFPDAIHREATAAELAQLMPERVADAPALSALDDIVDGSLLEVPDEAELRLRLRIDLAEPLDLPPQPARMRYVQDVPASVRERITGAVQAADTSASQRDWLLQQPWWRQFFQRRWPQRFEAVRQRWYTGHRYLLALDDPHADLEPMADEVLAALQQFLPRHAWQIDGQPQRLVLTAADAEAARQCLIQGERQAVSALIDSLSEPFMAT